MKLSALFFLLSLSSVFAKETYTQTVHFNLDLKNVTLEEAFNVLRKQSEFEFFYNNDQLDTRQRISIKANQAQLGEVLSKILGNRYDYRIEDRYVLISRKKANTSTSPSGQSQSGDVVGVVRDAKGETLMGVAIQAINALGKTIKGTLTDADGKFSLANISPDVKLKISYVGMATQTVELKGRQSLEIILKEDAILEEVVVVGYGELNRSDVTGAMSSISVGNKAKERPIVNVADLIQGQAAGVQIVNNSGAPGSEVTFNIRGVGSFSNHEPLIVVDGVPIDGGKWGGEGVTSGDISQSLATPFIGNSGLAGLNPNDIASIEVLKDASATAIYGSRASNGVVLITTKQGIPGRNIIEYNFNVSTTKISERYDLLTSKEYMDYYNEAYENDEQRDKILYDPESELYAERAAQNSDWQDLIFQTALSTNHQLSISGGDQLSKYMISGNYTNTEGIIRTSSLERIAGRINYSRTLSDKLRIDVNASYSDTKNNAFPQAVAASGSTAHLSVISAALGYEPFNRAYTAEGDPEDNINNPLSLLYNRTDEYVAKALMSRLNASYEIIRGLTFRVNTSFTSRTNMRNAYFGRGTVTGQNAPNGFAMVHEGTTESVLGEYTLNLNRQIGKRGRLNLVGGYSWQSWKSHYKSISASDFPSDATSFYDMSLANTIQKPATGLTESALASFIGRAVYSYSGRYVFAFSGRYDGSSRLAPKNRWNFFPSLSVAWNAYRESFLKDYKTLSTLRLRTNWGRTGNQTVAPGRSQAIYSPLSSAFGNGLSVGYILSRFENPYLKWETTDQWNLGFDLGFLKDRFQLTTNFYLKEIIDQLGGVPIPADTGFTSYTGNMGKIRNTGVELEGKARILEGKVGWDVSANISFNRNKVLSLGDVEERTSSRNYVGGSMSIHTSRVGGPMYMFQGHLVDGVYQNQAEVDAGPVDEKVPNVPGSLKFVDTNGDNKINTADIIELGSPFPDYVFGITNNWSYDNFLLTVFINGSIGNKIANLTRYRLDGLVATNRWNASREAYENRWTGEGTSNYYPQAISLRNEPFNGRFTNMLLEDGSYVRLKNVTLSYQLPLTKMGVKLVNSARIFATATNLLTITDYSGYDPEVSGAGSTAPGVDFYTSPQGKTFTFGINVVL